MIDIIFIVFYFVVLMILYFVVLMIDIIFIVFYFVVLMIDIIFIVFYFVVFVDEKTDATSLTSFGFFQEHRHRRVRGARLTHRASRLVVRRQLERRFKIVHHYVVVRDR